MNASISRTPAPAQASTIRWASSAVSASGFSHRTCLPARPRRSSTRVEVVRERDVDGVDVRVGQERLVRAVGPRDASSRGDACRRRRRPATRSPRPRRRSAVRMPGMTFFGRCRPSTGSPTAACSRRSLLLGFRSRTGPMVPALIRNDLDTAPAVLESGTAFERKEHKPEWWSRAGSRRRARAAQRDGSARESQRDRPRAPRQRPALALGPRRPHRPDPERDPRRSSASWSPAGFVHEDARRRCGTPGRPSPLVRPEPARRGRPRASRSPSTRSPRPRSGLGGEVLDHVRVDRPRGHVSRRRRRADLAELADGAPRRRLDRPTTLVGVGRRASSASCAAATGSSSMAPNLGWRDVPLGDALAGDARPAGPDLGRERGRPRRRSRSIAAARPSARTRVLFISGDVGVGGGLIVDGAAADRRGRLRRRGRPHAGQPGRASPCRCGSVGCWETEVGERRPAAPGRPPAGRRSPRRRRRPARGRGRFARSRSRRSPRSAAGSASGWPAS